MKLYSRVQKRLSALVITTVISTSLASPIIASDYESHWAKDAIERWHF